MGGLCYYFCPPSYNLPYFCHPLSLFPRFLFLYLSISIILPAVITPSYPLSYHHHASCILLCLPPSLPPSVPPHLRPSLMPFLLALFLLKPVKGYQALLSISGNSIKARPYERLFFLLLSKWPLAAATIPKFL